MRRLAAVNLGMVRMTFRELTGLAGPVAQVGRPGAGRAHARVPGRPDRITARTRRRRRADAVVEAVTMRHASTRLHETP